MELPSSRPSVAPATVKRVCILTSMACYLIFCHLLMVKLNAVESYCRSTGQRFHLGIVTSEITGLPVRLSCDDDCGAPWINVFIPLWVADALTIAMHIVFSRLRLAWTPTTSTHNARIEHVVGLCRSILYAVFKVLLLRQLDFQDDPFRRWHTGMDSWWVVFSPIYVAALLQMAFHLLKHVEPIPASRSPPRRPGLSISIFDLLAVNVSCKMEGVFYVSNASWASVLWPLWIAAAICTIAILLGVCLGIPLLLRRLPSTQLPFVLPPIMLLVAAYTFGVQGLNALTGWLDGDQTISVIAIAVPITSAVWSLTILLTIVAISSLCHPTIAVTDPHAQEPRREGLLSLDPSMLPRLMVMESSTLLRQASTRAIERYDTLAVGGGGDTEPDLEAGRAKKQVAEGSEPKGDLSKLNLIEAGDNDLDEAQSCWVCFEPLKSQAVLLQCGHAGLCLKCATSLWQTRAPCPMCRQSIDLIARFGDTVTVDGQEFVAPRLPRAESMEP